MDGVTIPGTAQIRKIGAALEPMELLKLCAELAGAGLDKKLFSVLSRVYTEHKGFKKTFAAGMEEYVSVILSSNVAPELKMQTFTSFELPDELAPDAETIKSLVESCNPRRLNIAAYFLLSYGDPAKVYPLVLGNRTIFKIYVSSSRPPVLIDLIKNVISNEGSETVTGLIRGIRENRRYIAFKKEDDIRGLTEQVFAAKNVFYTSKLIYCLAMNVPENCLPPRRELYKLLRITVNYDERSTREFAYKYSLDFDTSDAAICSYILRNKKTVNEKMLVSRFAAHLCRIDSDSERGKLLHLAFKRGGLFRMYAGCMQDGKVDEEKQRRFRYTEEQINWVKTMPGLKTKE